MASGDANADEYVVLRSGRRKHLRSQLLVLKIRATDDRGTFFGYAKTLGTGGMFISSVNPREPGDIFDISFRLTGEKNDVKCRCEVVWLREFEPKKRQDPGMGLKFLDLAPEDRTRIEEWLKVNKL